MATNSVGKNEPGSENENEPNSENKLSTQKINLQLLRQTFTLAHESVLHNNQPFGALVADQDDVIILTAENRELTQDFTCHAEMNLVRALSAFSIPSEKLTTYTLYTSTEPCAMCASAIAKSKIGRIVYGCSGDKLSQIANGGSLPIPCRDITSRCKRKIHVDGPVLEEEAVLEHMSYWPSRRKN